MTITVQINIPQLEDLVLNPLNNILLLSQGSIACKKVEKEIRRIVTVLEKEHLINKRIRIRSLKKELNNS